MNARRKERFSTAVLLAYLDGELRPDEAAALERATVDSESVRRKLDTLHELRRALQAPVPTLEEREVELDWKAATRPRSAGRAARGTAWTVLAAAAALVLGVGLGQLLPRPDDFPSHRTGATRGPNEAVARSSGELDVRSKSASPTTAATRWAGMRVFRSPAGGGGLERVKTSVRRGDGLAFAYTNLGASPFGYLMIFCVDAAGDVHWFHPAYTSEQSNPASVPIRAGQDVALSELVWLSLPEGQLTFYAAFTREPLDVWSVESWLEAHPLGGAGFVGPDAVVSELSVTVE